MKKGDMVKVVGTMTGGGWSGDNGKIIPINDVDPGDYTLYVGGNWYPASSLELQPDVSHAKSAPLAKGDMVSVTGPIRQQTNRDIGGNYGALLLVSEVDERDDTYSVGAWWYPRSSLELRTKGATTIPQPVKAMRFNDGKPQLSYLLDFPVAFPDLSDEPALEFIYSDDFIKNMADFYRGGCVNILNSVIVGELLPKLQKSITGKSYHPSMEGVRVDSPTDLIAAYPDAFDDFCNVCSNGTIKYSRGNWKGGFPTETLIDCAIRHYRKYKMGLERDSVDDKMMARWKDDEDLRAMFGEDYDAFKKQFKTHHLSHVMWNLMVLIEQAA